MNEGIEVGNKVDLAIFLHVSIEYACPGFEFREVVDLPETVISAEKELLVVVVDHDIF